MAVRNVTKQLGGVEDLTLRGTGSDTEQQTRAGTSVSITKLRLLQPVDLLINLKALDITKFTDCMTLGQNSINDSNGGFYYFDLLDNTTPESLPDVVIPDSLVGRWKRLTLKVS